MTKQEIVDLVVPSLLKQNMRSTMVTGNAQHCAYRGKGGLKCAVGFLIPDDIYDKSMEGLEVRDIREKYPQLENVFVHNLLLSKLQFAHDYHYPDKWKEELKIICVEFELRWNPEWDLI